MGILIQGISKIILEMELIVLTDGLANVIRWQMEYLKQINILKEIFLKPNEIIDSFNYFCI